MGYGTEAIVIPIKLDEGKQEFTASLAHGSNIVVSDRNSPASVKIPGRTLVNLLGKDGNCEDTSKWSGVGSTLALDTNNKVFSSKSIKITLSGSLGGLNKNIISSLDSSKYYMLSFYAKNSNITSGVKGYFYTNGTGRVTKTSSFITNALAFERKAVTLQPSDWGTGSTVCTVEVDGTGSATQYGYIDGVMVNEITSADYALTEAELLDKYPYVDSVQHLEGVYVKTESEDDQESYLYVMDFLGEGENLQEVQLPNGTKQYVKNKIWERKTFDGSLPWAINENFTGYKAVYTNLGIPTPSAIDKHEHIVKYNGKILLPYPDGQAFTTGDQENLDSSGNVYIGISSTDSGWGDAYTPSQAEIQAYFMGWVMSLADGNLYNDATSATQKYWTKLYCGVGTSGTMPTGTKVVGDGVTSVPTVVNDQGYTPYELHYKLATPIPSYPVQAEGSLETFAGNCTVTLGEGAVVREVVVPIKDNSRTYYALNILSSTSYSSVNPFSKIPKELLKIYKGESVDTTTWTVGTSPSGYGGIFYYTLASNVDPSAVYTVTYLAEPYQISASALSAELTYATNISTVLQRTVEELNNAKMLISILENEKANRNQPPWIYPTMLNGWVSDPNRPIRYCKDEFGKVLIDGVAYGGTTTNGTAVFRVDSKYRPEHTVSKPIGTETFSVCNLDISSDGYAKIYGMSSNTWIFPTGMIYRVKQ